MKCWSTFCVNYFLRYYLMMQHQPIVKRVNGTHEWAHRPYQLLSAPNHCCLYKHRRQDERQPLISSCVHSNPPSPAYMRQWTGSALVQVMACRLFGAKPLPEPMLAYCQLDSWEKFRWNSNRNSTISIQENAFENVVRNLTTIFSRPQYLNWMQLISFTGGTEKM